MVENVSVHPCRSERDRVSGEEDLTVLDVVQSGVIDGPWSSTLEQSSISDLDLDTPLSLETRTHSGTLLRRSQYRFQ